MKNFLLGLLQGLLHGVVGEEEVRLGDWRGGGGGGGHGDELIVGRKHHGRVQREMIEFIVDDGRRR